jgi:hypothetical protein
MAQAFSTVATLAGARKMNNLTLATRFEDLGGKLELVISAVNTLNTAVSNIHLALQRMMVCATSFASALSTTGLNSNTATSTAATILNFSR